MERKEEKWKQKALLNAIPEEITLDIPEIDYAKAKNIIENKIKEILKEKQLNISNEDFSVTYYNIYGGMDYFYKAIISGKDTNNSKEIKIKYNNTDKHNASDEQAVHNLQIKDPKYGTYTPEDFFSAADWTRYWRKSLE